MSVPGTILAITASSAGLKFQLFDRSPDLKRLARGTATNLGGAPSFSATDDATHVVDKRILSTNYTHEVALQLILDWVKKKNEAWQVTAIAHRITHGGTLFTQSVRVTPEIIGQLRSLVPFAHLHQSHNVEPVEIIARILPDMPQIVCFDTTFHANHNPLFNEYALPQKIRAKGVRRFGFHGLAYEWVSTVLKRDEPALARGRVIAAHLGNGSSLCALRDGVSIDTTMGMTLLEGLPMATRSGSIDPGIIFYMLRELNLSPEQVEHILYNESGLLGLSEKTSDLKQLQDDKTNPKAQFALDFFALKVAQSMGMLAVAIGGLDGVIFTGGIGENSVLMREKILGHLTFFKSLEMRIIRANEERVMALHTQNLLGAPTMPEKKPADEW